MKKYCVISHTHWDREWYLPYENFRLKLVDLIDSLLEILEKEPEYIFHMDAQTIVLEDYLEIRPENKELLQKYIKSRNIIIGPWYVQNDFFLSSAEATVRNLIISIKISNEWGEDSFVGYTPDQFGLPAQLPQILDGFGIDSVVFGRGDALYDEEKKAKIPHPSECMWESPDGTKVFSILLPRWYNNMQRIHENPDKAATVLNEEAARLDEWKTSPYYLMMHGVDHLEPQGDLKKLLKEVNLRLEDAEVVQTTMHDYIENAKMYMSDVVKKGDFRKASASEILHGTLSTRNEIKIKNFNAQNAIMSVVEPLYSMISVLGAKKLYPKSVVERALKLLIQSHAHDSICCCSHNNVMKHMEDRLLSIEEITNELTERGIKFINHHIERNENDEDKYYITLVNTTQTDFMGVVNARIEIDVTQEIESFAIVDANGKNVPYSIINHERTTKACFSPLNLPGNIAVDRYEAEIFVEKLEGFSYENYTVIPGKNHEQMQSGKLLENEYLKVTIDADKINLSDKVSGIEYKDVLYFDDLGDRGDSYDFRAVEGDTPIVMNLDKVEEISNSGLRSSVKLTYKAQLPETTNQNGRSTETKECTVECTLSLAKGEHHVTVNTEVDNNSRHHLLRAMINTGIKSDMSYASSIFDITEHDRSKIEWEITDGVRAVNGFVYLKDGSRKLAIYTMGLYCYNHHEDGKVALHLLRSTDAISNKRAYDTASWSNTDNLVLGKTKYSFAIMPYKEDDSFAASYEKIVNNKPICYCDSVNKKKFVGGTPAVQSSDVREVFIKKDKYESLVLPHKKQIFDISDEVLVSTLKKAENSDDLILRVYNPWEEEKEISLEGYDVSETDFLEKSMKNFSGIVEKKKINTYKIKGKYDE